MKKYNPKQIEKRWQSYWLKKGINKTKNLSDKPKYYILDMFPYPSGAGLHVGHPKGYIATDVVARMKMMQGYNVLHPMGWDAFGLPAENYAIANKVHPKAATDKNIATFKKQLGKIGFTYDWSREVNTTDPKYYKWTQWTFLQMFKKGLAYESFEPVNWCPVDKTVLANEDLENGRCERCGSLVERRPMRQWVLRITKYADRMLNDLEKLTEWPEAIKEMQRNWIGRSEGARIKFVVRAKDSSVPAKGHLPFKRGGQVSPSYQEGAGGVVGAGFLEVFTTRPDTLFGATYVVVAPEHPLVKKLESRIKNYGEVKEYVERANKKTDLERTELQKEKSGVELRGVKAINPINGEEIPVWIADYVLANYGTGAIMAVPAHDERDYEFAQKYNLPIKQVIAPTFVQADNPPREGKKMVRRKTVHVILENPSGEKILMLQWKGAVWEGREPRTFIIGGIEAGEDMAVAAEREVHEETGYKNVRFVKKLNLEVHTQYYAAHKGENRQADINILHFKLNDEEKENVAEEELKKHDAVWVAKTEAGRFVNVVDGPFIWNWFVTGGQAFTENGELINSDFLNDLRGEEAKKKMIEWLEKHKAGEKKVNYKLRDWVFSRQRYWGEPIPIIHCDQCGVVAVPEKDLPVKLPDVKNYEPTGTGESPLANIKEWVNVKCPECKGPTKRETNTMPQWAGSSWYYLRYIDPKNSKALVDKKLEKYWSPVDFYVGGAEHATRHLIYARFWHKFLFDIGAVNYEEPFTRLQNVGLIMAEDGRKMSKRWGNVINPDDVIEQYGADSLRVYEMFMGPFAQAVAWSTQGLVGAHRFIEKVWALQEKVERPSPLAPLPGEREDNEPPTHGEPSPLRRGTEGEVSSSVSSGRLTTTLLHQTIKKVSEDIETMRFNTAISQLMILANEMSKAEKISKENYALFVQILAPFAPHLAEELWATLGHKKSIFTEAWPKYDPELAKSEEFVLAIQVNGKLRDTITVPSDIDEASVKAKALASEKVRKWLGGMEPKKVIYIKGKLVSVVV